MSGTPMNREERRRIAREDVERYRTEGLPPRLSLGAMFAHTAALRRILERKDDPERGTQLALAFHAGFELSMAHVPAEPRVACSAGCSMCCHNWISVTAPEVFVIAAEIGRRASAADDGARIARAALAGKGLDRDARLERRLACPMLASDLCSIYAVRPLACRGFFSLSLEACQAVFKGEGEDIPAWRAAMLLRGIHDRCMAAAIRAAGLAHGAFEMTEGLTLAFADPAAQARWLAGEDVFAAATPDGQDDAEENLFREVLIAGAAGKRLPENPWTATA